MRSPRTTDELADLLFRASPQALRERESLRQARERHQLDRAISRELGYPCTRKQLEELTRALEAYDNL